MQETIYQSFEKTQVLVVGGAGFVGSNLVKLLLDHVRDINITIVDPLLSSEIWNVPADSRVRFWEASITDFRILANIQDEYDYIFHLATYHGNQSSIFDPIKDHENNTLTTLKLFERIREFKNIKKIVYSSAGCSVARKTFEDAVATTEADPIEIHQDSPYSISKIIGEFYSAYYYKECGLPIVRARFQNVYGPGEILGAGNWRGTYASVWRNVTPNFIYKSLKGEAVLLENGGISTRDFIFVTDICRGLLRCATLGTAGDVYNLASGKETSIKELADMINDSTGNRVAAAVKPKRLWDNSGKRFASAEKAREELGFGTEIDIKEGITRTVEWTRENLNMIETVMKKHEEHMKRIHLV